MIRKWDIWNYWDDLTITYRISPPLQEDVSTQSSLTELRHASTRQRERGRESENPRVDISRTVEIR